MSQKPTTQPITNIIILGDTMPLPQNLIDSVTNLTNASQALVDEIAKERSGASGSIPATDVPGLVSQIDALTQRLQAALTPPT